LNQIRAAEEDRWRPRFLDDRTPDQAYFDLPPLRAAA